MANEDILDTAAEQVQVCNESFFTFDRCAFSVVTSLLARRTSLLYVYLVLLLRAQHAYPVSNTTPCQGLLQ